MRFVPHSTPIRLYPITIMQESSTFLVRRVLSEPDILPPAAEQPAAGLSRLHVHKACQGCTDHATGQGEDEVDGHRVVMQRPVGERVQCGLDELAHA